LFNVQLREKGLKTEFYLQNTYLNRRFRLTMTVQLVTNNTITKTDIFFY